MKCITPENGTIYAFAAGTPEVAEVEFEEEFKVTTLDALHGAASEPEGNTSDLDMSETNPATGPIKVKDAKKGEFIGIEILEIEAGKTGIGLSQGRYRQIRIEDGLIAFAQGIDLRIRPHIGVIGALPSQGTFSCKVPGEHGGNLDTNEIRSGSMFTVPVQVDGAMIAVGDVHAVMADGEVNGAGLEVPATVTLRVRRISDPLVPALHVVTRESVVILASGPTFEEAARIAVSRCARLLKRLFQLNDSDAMLMTGYCGELRVSQIVNPLVTAKVVFPRQLLEPRVEKRYRV